MGQYFLNGARKVNRPLHTDHLSSIGVNKGIISKSRWLFHEKPLRVADPDTERFDGSLLSQLPCCK